jgi:hypothetical protein
MLIFSWVYNTGIFILFHVRRMTDKNGSRVMKSRSTCPDEGGSQFVLLLLLQEGK